MYGIIYVTQNLLNGMKYIGQHQCQTDADSYLGSGSKLVKDIKKFGKENFKRATLYIANSIEELNEKEIAFIKAFNAVERDDYYNIARGGDSIDGEMNPMYGRKLTEEERKRIGDSQRGEKHWNYGQHWSEDVKHKISESHKGKPAWNKGVLMREESKQKLSKANSNKVRTEEMKQHMRDAQFGRKHSDEVKQKIGEANRRYHEQGKRRTGKPVMCVETGVVYATGYDAERALGIGKGSISSCLAGSCKTLKGFHWRYATPEESVQAVIA